MHYFAYGSNMLSSRMKKRVPSADEGRLAYIDGYVLRFHKIGLSDGSAKCNAFYTGNPDDRLYGVVYSVDGGDKQDLDKEEGVGSGYVVKQVIVTVPDFGKVTAWTYAAEPAYIDEELQAYAWYVKIVLDGALEHLLPHDYILKNISSAFWLIRRET